MNTKFLYYITDLHQGIIEGTNNYDTALELSACEDYFVLCVSTGEWMTTDGRQLVKEVNAE